MSERKRFAAELAAEVAFAVLPLLVVLMVLADVSSPGHIWEAPEWAFGASILFGQTLVRFVSRLARKGRAAMGPVALAVALLVVFGLAPSLTVLTMTLRAREQQIQLKDWLVIWQVVLFATSAVVYMILGVVSEVLAHGVVERTDARTLGLPSASTGLRAAEPERSKDYRGS